MPSDLQHQSLYQILLCLHPHIYKSIKTTPDLHQSKILHLVCYNQYDIVPHQTNSFFALFHYITTHIKNPLNCTSSYTISDRCTACWQQFLLTCSDFSCCSKMSFMIQLHQNQNTNLSPFLVYSTTLPTIEYHYTINTIYTVL